MNKGLTKIVNKRCQDCREYVSILCDEECFIVAARCPDCLRIFLITSIEIEQLVSYLKKKNWKEAQARLSRIEMIAPHPEVYVFIPPDKSLVDYVTSIKQVVNTIALYYGKTMSEVLLEILQEENF